LLKGKNLVKYGLHALVLIGVVWAGIRTIDGGEFRLALSRFNWWFAPLACACAATAMVIKGWYFATLVKRISDLSRRLGVTVYVTGQSMSLLPGGVAARAGLLSQVGVKIEHGTPAVAMSSITDQLAFIVAGMAAAIFFPAARQPVFILLAVLAVISLTLGIQASRSWLLSIVEGILGRFGLAERWRQFIEAFAETANLRILAEGVLNSLIAFTFYTAALYVCVVGMGHTIPIPTAALAYTIPTMLGRIAATPGGVGPTEVGMVGVLARVPGLSVDEAAAATLVFRIASVLFNASLGGLVYLLLWRREVERA
jgi:uncharacterized protein (TIRG00374 family)